MLFPSRFLTQLTPSFVEHTSRCLCHVVHVSRSLVSSAPPQEVCFFTSLIVLFVTIFWTRWDAVSACLALTSSLRLRIAMSNVAPLRISTRSFRTMQMPPTIRILLALNREMLLVRVAGLSLLVLVCRIDSFCLPA